MGEFALDVELREGRGKGVARKLRAAGRIPGVCYRRNAEPLAISLDPSELDHVLRKASSGINTLLDLKVAGGGDFDGRQVLIKELQSLGLNVEILNENEEEIHFAEDPSAYPLPDLGGINLAGFED